MPVAVLLPTRRLMAAKERWVAVRMAWRRRWRAQRPAWRVQGVLGLYLCGNQALLTRNATTLFAARPGAGVLAHLVHDAAVICAEHVDILLVQLALGVLPRVRAAGGCVRRLCVSLQQRHAGVLHRRSKDHCCGVSTCRHMDAAGVGEWGGALHERDDVLDGAGHLLIAHGEALSGLLLVALLAGGELLICEGPGGSLQRQGPGNEDQTLYSTLSS